MSSVARSVLFIVVVVVVVLAARFGGWRESTERDVARWFMPGALGYEPGRNAPAPSEPAFLTRAFSGLNTPEARRWGERNDLTPSLAFSHHLTVVFPPALFAKHPEFFPLADGRRVNPPPGSYFWNPDIARPDVARYAADAARKHFEAHPDAVSFALGVNDALIWGESPELLSLATPTRWFRERPDYSAVVFTFMNRAATELARTHPEKYLGALAYYWAENTPAFPVHPQVVPYLTADRSQGYDEAFRAEEFALQKKWGALAGRSTGSIDSAADDSRTPPRRLGVYDYVYGGGFLIPRLHPRLLAEHLRHARGVGFTDYYAEVNPNWGLDGPMPWLTAQLVRDPSRDPAGLLDEYYARFFQEAAAPMRRFFERCGALWLAQPGPAYWLKHYRNESQAVVFPSAATAELRALLDEAAAAARSGRVKARVAFVADTFGVTERFVAFHAARTRVLHEGFAARPTPALAASLAAFLGARAELVSYTDALRKREPRALHPFEWSDYLKNDPVPTALFALRRGGAGEKSARMAPVFAQPEVADLWAAIVADADRERASGGSTSRELLHDPGMSGPLQPPRMIAGLTYGVALPPGWQSKVEPSQHHRAELTDAAGERVLRISGSKDTMLSQWAKVGGAGLHRAALSVRGHVSPSTAVSLIFAFLDAQHRHVGFKSVRLPDGAWPDWVTLRQAGTPPPSAAWVGIGLRVQNQVQGDWVEARRFSLVAGAE